jgi:hypothetical protein
MQPAAQGLGASEQGGLPGEKEERSLEAILGIVEVSENPAANAEHHGSVSGYQSGEGVLIPITNPVAQKLRIRSEWKRQAMQVSKEDYGRRRPHISSPVGMSGLLINLPPHGPMRTPFSLPATPLG